MATAAVLEAARHERDGMKGGSGLSGKLSEGEAKPRRGWSRDVTVPRREGFRKTSGSGLRAKDVEGTTNQ